MESKKSFLLLFVTGIFFQTLVFAQEANLNPEANFRVPCETFRNGTFFYTTADREGIKVVRKGKKQTEYNQVSGEVAKFKVKWTEECVMELTFLGSNMPSRLKKGWILLDTLLITDQDFYEFKSTRYGIKNYSAARKILTKAEKNKRQKEYEKKMREDSLAVAAKAKFLTDSVYKDSVNKINASLASEESAKKAKEEAAKKAWDEQHQDPAERQKQGEKVSDPAKKPEKTDPGAKPAKEEKKKQKPLKEDNKEKEKPAGSKEKGEKPPKGEKKAGEKPPKEAKEKKVKPPKEDKKKEK